MSGGAGRSLLSRGNAQPDPHLFPRATQAARLPPAILPGEEALSWAPSDFVSAVVGECRRSSERELLARCGHFVSLNGRAGAFHSSR
jgi:hypothetical protein